MNKPESYPCPAHLVGFLTEQPLPAGFETPPYGWVYVGGAQAEESRSAPGILWVYSRGESWVDHVECIYTAGSPLGGGHFAAPRHWIKTNS